MVERTEITLQLGSCKEKSDHGKCRVDAVYIRQNMYSKRKTVLQVASFFTEEWIERKAKRHTGRIIDIIQIQ